jgi:hypothetical protein
LANGAHFCLQGVIVPKSLIPLTQSQPLGLADLVVILLCDSE